MFEPLAHFDVGQTNRSHLTSKAMHDALTNFWVSFNSHQFTKLLHHRVLSNEAAREQFQERQRARKMELEQRLNKEQRFFGVPLTESEKAEKQELRKQLAELPNEPSPEILTKLTEHEVIIEVKGFEIFEKEHGSHAASALVLFKEWRSYDSVEGWTEWQQSNNEYIKQAKSAWELSANLTPSAWWLPPAWQSVVNVGCALEEKQGTTKIVMTDGSILVDGKAEVGVLQSVAPSVGELAHILSRK